MPMIGGDAPALFHFAQQLSERRRKIQRAATRLGQLVQAAEWVGPDRDRFLQEWNSEHVPQIQSICNDLDDAASRVTRHAQAQEETSR